MRGKSTDVRNEDQLRQVLEQKHGMTPQEWEQFKHYYHCVVSMSGKQYFFRSLNDPDPETRLKDALAEVRLHNDGP